MIKPAYDLVLVLPSIPQAVVNHSIHNDAMDSSFVCDCGIS